MEDEKVWISDQVWDQLFDTLLWQASELDGEEVTRDDIHPSSQEAVKDSFRSFVRHNDTSLAVFREHTNRGWEDVAHDFVLTANRHGAGFWDRCYCVRVECEFADRLTVAAHAYPMDVCVGDDGFVYVV